MTKNQNDRWGCSLHEAGHALLSKILVPHKKVKAEITYSTELETYCGLCSSPFHKVPTLDDAIFTAAGAEAARYAAMYQPPDTCAQNQSHEADASESETATTGSRQAAVDEKDFVRRVLSSKPDAKYLYLIIFDLYPDYRDIPYFHRTHRRIRARARLILRQHLPELMAIASEIYTTGTFSYAPPSGDGASTGGKHKHTKEVAT